MVGRDPEVLQRPNTMRYPCTGIWIISLLGTFRPYLNSKHMEENGLKSRVCEHLKVRAGSEICGPISLLGSERSASLEQVSGSWVRQCTTTQARWAKGPAGCCAGDGMAVAAAWPAQCSPPTVREPVHIPGGGTREGGA
jgi:hypothetical protein